MKNTGVFLIMLIAVIILSNINKYAGFAGALVFVVYFIISNRPYYYIIKANKKYKSGDREGALVLYEKASKCVGCPVDLKMTYGILLLKLGYLDKADTELKSILDIKTNQNTKWKAKLYYSLVVWKREGADKAAEILEDIYKNYKSSFTYEVYGLILNSTEDLNKALEINKEGNGYDDTNLSIMDNLGKTYYLLGDNSKAESTYKDLLDRQPKFPDAYYNYGLVLLKDGKKEEALEKMKESLNYKFSFLNSITKDDIEKKIKEVEE